MLKLPTAHLRLFRQVMLNAVKCTIATFFFLLLVPFRAHVWRVAVHTGVTDASAPADRPARMDMLVLSAFLGITIGDIVWLHALKALGARRLILVDSLKPFVGALVAWLLLGERIKSESALAVLVTMAGVLLVALQRHHSSPQSDDIELLQRDAAGPYNSGPRTRCLQCGAFTEAQNRHCPACGAQLISGAPAALPHMPQQRRPPVREMSAFLFNPGTNVPA
jgi:uncharacterized membrane protein